MGVMDALGVEIREGNSDKEYSRGLAIGDKRK